MTRVRVGAAVGVVVATLALVAAQAPELGRPEAIAPGIRLYRLTDPTLVDPPAPVAVYALRLEPARVRLRSALALDRVLGTATVLEMTRRHGAIAGVNAGFFAPNGDPAGLLKVDGELVSDAPRPRGAVGIVPRRFGSFRLVFDRVTVAVTVRFDTDRGEQAVVMAAIDTPRQPGRLTVYTPRYADDTGTDSGTEWVLRGRPLRVVERRERGRTTIPPDGVVLSFEGPPTGVLAALVPGRTVRVVPVYRTHVGRDPTLWQRARDAVGGAGLLVREGLAVDDWTDEGLTAAFVAERHPRTLVGVDAGGEVWLIVVDGRQPGHSVGMTFRDLQRLATRLRLRDALNLDGGGSSTLVVRDAIVNQPSDPQGPRRVSDALLVLRASPER